MTDGAQPRSEAVHFPVASWLNWARTSSPSLLTT